MAFWGACRVWSGLIANSGGFLAGVKTGLIIAFTCDSTLVSDCSRELGWKKDGLSNQVGGFGWRKFVQPCGAWLVLSNSWVLRS